MHALRMAVRMLCIIPFVTGGADIIDGVGLLTLGSPHRLLKTAR